MNLVCSRRCGGELFRGLFAEVDVDSEGAYQDHRFAHPGFICLSCGSPALDLGAVPEQMEADEAEDSAPVIVADILCPVCETLVQVRGEMECPNCGSPLEVA
jgi:hypothetical protein